MLGAGSAYHEKSLHKLFLTKMNKLRKRSSLSLPLFLLCTETSLFSLVVLGDPIGLNEKNLICSNFRERKTGAQHTQQIGETTKKDLFCNVPYLGPFSNRGVSSPST